MRPGARTRSPTGCGACAELVAGEIPRLEQAVGPVATAFAYVGRMYVIGRGIEFATAREVALKLTETCRVAAEPLTATDLAHGPIAALDALFPVWTIASRDESLPARGRGGRHACARPARRSSRAATPPKRSRAPRTRCPCPSRRCRSSSPLLSVVPGQLFAGALAHAKGLDPDRPVGLSKVTRAR